MVIFRNILLAKTKMFKKLQLTKLAVVIPAFITGIQ